MEPYFWAKQTAEEMIFLRSKGSPYAFTSSYNPDWGYILKDELVELGIAESWIHFEDGWILVNFPENFKPKQFFSDR